MGFSSGAKDAAVNGVRSMLTSGVGYLSAHTADPGATGANEVAGDTRGSSTFPTASGGTGSTGTQTSITIPSAASTTTVTHVGVWTAATAGTFVCGIQLVDGQNNARPEVFSTGGGTLKYTPTLTETA